MGIFDLKAELDKVEQAIDEGRSVRKVAVAAKREFLENILDSNGIDRNSYDIDEIVYSGLMGGQVILQAGKNTAITITPDDIRQYMDYAQKYEQLAGRSFPRDSGFHGAFGGADRALLAKEILLDEVRSDDSENTLEENLDSFKSSYLAQREEALISFTGLDNEDLDSYGFVNIDPETKEAVFIDLEQTNQQDEKAFIRIPATVVFAYNEMNQEFMAITGEVMDDSNFHYQLYEAYGAAEATLKEQQDQQELQQVYEASNATIDLGIKPKI